MGEAHRLASPRVTPAPSVTRGWVRRTASRHSSRTATLRAERAPRGAVRRRGCGPRGPPRAGAPPRTPGRLSGTAGGAGRAAATLTLRVEECIGNEEAPDACRPRLLRAPGHRRLSARRLRQPSVRPVRRQGLWRVLHRLRSGGATLRRDRGGEGMRSVGRVRRLGYLHVPGAGRLLRREALRRELHDRRSLPVGVAALHDTDRLRDLRRGGRLRRSGRLLRTSDALPGLRREGLPRAVRPLSARRRRLRRESSAPPGAMATAAASAPAAARSARRTPRGGAATEPRRR